MLVMVLDVLLVMYVLMVIEMDVLLMDVLLMDILLMDRCIIVDGNGCIIGGDGNDIGVRCNCWMYYW